ncbi:hypothetical protein RI129_004490 [Pyrocoelia pectoralis]|uniref:Regulatory protein zeste n=1 Tax=Pyrocoelia pectoralis TaxID=417401 RepID=A0AAN7ZQR0_9COLE
MSTNKKRRAENFTQKEEQLLLRLVKLKAKEIESKKTDANNLKIKCDAWAQVTTMFNCHSGESHRDTDTLRNKYNNIKKRAKVKFSEEKKYMYGTGGGPAMKNADDDLQTATLEKQGTSGACTKKPDPLKTKLGKWADKKKDLADLQRKCFLEEHKLKLQHLAEKHQQYIALQEKESEQRLKLEKEKHDLEMKILRHQNSNIV